MELKGSNGVRYTKELFYEWGNTDAPYTLRLEDHKAKSGKEYKSIYKIYMDSVDEYSAAIKIVGCIDHWRKLCDVEWFMNGFPQGAGKNMRRLNGGLKQWREDMLQRDASEAKKLLMQMAEDGVTSAARYLHEVSTKASKGRPTRKVTKVDNSQKVSSLHEAYSKAKS